MTPAVAKLLADALGVDMHYLQGAVDEQAEEALLTEVVAKMREELREHV